MDAKGIDMAQLYGHKERKNIRSPIQTLFFYIIVKIPNIMKIHEKK